jgi:hypothetical protein
LGLRRLHGVRRGLQLVRLVPNQLLLVLLLILLPVPTRPHQ